VETEVDASLQRAGITAVSPAMREVYRTLRRVAPTDLAILLLGETGSGKEVLTNLTHRWSNRASGPLVKVHCAALSETLLASELFGHEKGAFTGADKRKIGKFEQANGGTIFLDEVGEIPLDVQVKLLRVLQEREVDRVGGLDPVPVDVRVVAATNRDLRAMIAAGKFREDLYYRLQGIEVQVPPLRDRRQEIPALVEQFRSEVVASGQSRVRGFTTDAMDELFRRDWPGNIRELRSTVHRAMVLATGELVDRREVVAALPAVSPGAGPAAAPSVPVPSGAPSAPSRVAASAQPGEAWSDPAAVSSQPPAGGTAVPTEVAPRTNSASSAIPDPVAAQPTPAGSRPLRETTPDDAPAANAGPGSEVQLPPVVLSPVPSPATPGGPVPPSATRESVLAALPPRIQALYQRIVAAGSMGTQDHMAAAGVSHRTGLRDLQVLVEVGLIERVGTRRGARYRPTTNSMA
jgi:MoxR-like ATPase